MKLSIAELLKRVQYIIDKGKDAIIESSGNSSSYIHEGRFNGFRTISLVFLKSIYQADHPYYQEFSHIVHEINWMTLSSGIEILESVKYDIENGWLDSYKGLISAEIFSDFLQMSAHLLDEGYHHAAAVMIGSVLEEHLRQLAAKNFVDITFDKDGDTIIKKADRLTADLANQSVFNRLDQKNITAWLDLRNKAAHGKYSEYVIDQVKVMYSGVSEFIMRHPT